MFFWKYNLDKSRETASADKRVAADTEKYRDRINNYGQMYKKTSGHHSTAEHAEQVLRDDTNQVVEEVQTGRSTEHSISINVSAERKSTEGRSTRQLRGMHHSGTSTQARLYTAAERSQKKATGSQIGDKIIEQEVRTYGNI